MLEINTTKTLTASVVIGEQHVVSLNATLATDESSSHVSYSINNVNLYNKNKKECREQIVAFINHVFEAEDKKQ